METYYYEMAHYAWNDLYVFYLWIRGLLWGTLLRQWAYEVPIAPVIDIISNKNKSAFNNTSSKIRKTVQHVLR